jgi:hypothetical protein
VAIWIESHIELSEHPKVYDLSSSLGVSLAETVGLLHLLWHFTMRFAWRDGDLTKFTNIAIARGSKWEKDPDLFIKSLQECKWLDNKKIHDWQSFAGKLIRDRLAKEATRDAKIPPVVAKRTPKRVTKPLPSQAFTNQTNTTKPEEKPLAANNAASLTPQAEFVKKFGETYHQVTKEPFKADKKHYVMAAEMISKYGWDAVVKKTYILAHLCETGGAWFTEESGYAAFRIEVLSSRWNEILVGEKKDPEKLKELEFLKELKKAEASNERASAAINR